MAQLAVIPTCLYAPLDGTHLVQATDIRIILLINKLLSIARPTVGDRVKVGTH